MSCRSIQPLSMCQLLWRCYTGISSSVFLDFLLLGSPSLPVKYLLPSYLFTYRLPLAGCVSPAGSIPTVYIRHCSINLLFCPLRNCVKPELSNLHSRQSVLFFYCALPSKTSSLILYPTSVSIQHLPLILNWY